VPKHLLTAGCLVFSWVWFGHKAPRGTPDRRAAGLMSPSSPPQVDVEVSKFGSSELIKRPDLARQKRFWSGVVLDGAFLDVVESAFHFTLRGKGVEAGFVLPTEMSL